MDAVSDIFAFAAAQADYWYEFLSGSDYSSILSDDEMKALEAARLHVEEGIYDLLVLSGAKLADKLSKDGVVTRNYQRGATIKWRKIRVDPPAAWKNRLYGFEFEFSPDDKNERVLLYASLVVKIAARDDLAAKLAKQGTAIRVDGYYIYGEGFAVDKDSTFDSLAQRAADALGSLFLAVK